MKFAINVIGKSKVDFVPETGNRITGFNIYFLEGVGQYGVGEKGSKRFFSSDHSIKYDDVVIGVNYFEVSLSGVISGLYKEK